MKVSYNWLQKQFDTKLPVLNELADLFSFRVFEVEGMEKNGDDTIIDLKVLPDRAHYALSWEGIAYELGAALGVERKKFDIPEVPSNKDLKLNLMVSESTLCRRYVGRHIKGIEVSPSPEWLKSALEGVGQRSINTIVDLTNYVMLYTGQPLHAFDADKVKGGITVRAAQSGEMITTLDGKEVKLDPSILVIADDEGPLAIAGVKGGKKAEVTSTTKNIIIESANFDPASVRRTSTKVGIKNDSSKRFENDPTPELAAKGMLYISGLIAEQCPKAQFGEVVDIYNARTSATELSFSPEMVRTMLGYDVSDAQMEDLLDLLEIEVIKKQSTENGGVWRVKVPAFRLDLVIPEDIVEEIGRLAGYENITPVLPPKIDIKPAVNPQYYLSELLKNLLINEGFSETILYTLGRKGHYETAYPVATDKSFLRTSHLPNLETSITLNTRNADLLEQQIVKQFEIGKVFDDKGEHLHLGLAVGFAKKIKGTTPVDVIKEATKKLTEKFGVNFEVEMETKDLTAWAETSLDALLASIEVPKSYAELGFGKVVSIKYEPISPYPFAVRDVAVFVPAEVKPEQVREVIEMNKGPHCVRLRLFDTFTKDGKTSYAFRLVFQAHNKTLTEEEIKEPMDAIYAALKCEGWEIR